MRWSSRMDSCIYMLWLRSIGAHAFHLLYTFMSYSICRYWANYDEEELTSRS